MQSQDCPANSGENGLLEIGTRLLRGQYEVEAYLASGGFAVTYLARDSLARRVVLKECFPSELCARQGNMVVPAEGIDKRILRQVTARFVDEARRLAKLDHPNVVGVHQVFEENHTAYMAMDYVEGTELLDVSVDNPERMTRELVLSMLEDALKGIDYVHERGMLHRDISPDNILLDGNDRITLIDFGGARDQSAKGTDQAVMMTVKEGYSPHEFYTSEAEEGPSSDLYSLAATFYRVITDITPPDGLERLERIQAGKKDPYVPLTKGDWPHHYLMMDLIDRAMSVYRKDRPETAKVWLEELEACRPAEEKPLLAMIQHRQLTGKSSEVLPAEELERAINQMVGSSKGLVEEPRESAPVQEVAAEAPKAPEQSPTEPGKTPVDIFGNPVLNVDEWMRDQDRKSRMKFTIRKKVTPEEAAEGESGTGSSILKVLSSGLGLSGLSSPKTEN